MCWGGISGTEVSIVSIQADQSRPVNKTFGGYEEAAFQSYQFRQINPDYAPDSRGRLYPTKFQSYQFRQINPDLGLELTRAEVKLCFNRINSGRSIPTCDNGNAQLWGAENVSIVSIQADQSRLTSGAVFSALEAKSFNRINSGRSIPTSLSVLTFLMYGKVSIVSIQADQSRLGKKIHGFRWVQPRFNRINSGRSIPTLILEVKGKTMIVEVSIVSIQADQSRLRNHCQAISL